MSYKSIVVHLDTSRHTHLRLELALRVARQFGAHLTGMFAVFTPDARSLSVMAGTAEYYGAHAAQRTERRGALERLFHAELARAQVPGDWLATDDYATLAVPRRGRCADLIIAGQDDPEDPESYVGDFFAENLVMSAGRPVLLVPHASNAATFGTHLMVAWDGSREATRAVHDALPFMQRAKQTTVVTINGEKGEPHGSRIPGSDIAAVVARHGVEVEVAAIDVARDAPIGDVLLSQASDIGAALLVMGAYGHARWHERVMGGATRSILKSMTLPVLMSH